MCPYLPQLWFWRIMQERWSTLKTKDLNTRKNDLGWRRRNSRTYIDDQDQKQIPLLSHDDDNHTASYVLSQDSWPAATEGVWNSKKAGCRGKLRAKAQGHFPKVAEWISWWLWEGQQCRPQMEMCDGPQGEPLPLTNYHWHSASSFPKQEVLETQSSSRVSSITLPVKWDVLSEG